MFSALFRDKIVRWIVIIGGAVLLTTILIIVFLFLFSPKPFERKITAAGDDTGISRFSSTDFYLDEELDFFFQKKMYPLREQSTGWDEEEVRRFFIPVEKILLEYFQKRNENYLEEIFRNSE